MQNYEEWEIVGCWDRGVVVWRNGDTVAMTWRELVTMFNYDEGK